VGYTRLTLASLRQEECATDLKSCRFRIVACQPDILSLACSLIAFWATFALLSRSMVPHLVAAGVSAGLVVAVKFSACTSQVY
jgi:hypothetical protein